MTIGLKAGCCSGWSLHVFKTATRVVLASELAASLSINNSEPFLSQEYLFIPDLDLWSELFACDRSITYRLRDVLWEREKKRMPTSVYVEDSLALGPDFRSIFTHRYVRGNLSKIVALSPDPTHSRGRTVRDEP